MPMCVNIGLMAEKTSKGRNSKVDYIALQN